MMLAPKLLFEKLPPTRTILCVVAQVSPFDSHPLRLGLAVTDPYLGHATSLPSVVVPRRSLADKRLAWSPEELASMRSVAEAAAAHDAGALAFGLPLLEDEGGAPLAERRALVRLARDYDSGAAMTYWREGGGGHFRAPRSLVGARHGAAARPEVPLPPLRVELDGRLSRAEVLARRRDEPEIWSDVPDGADAAVALSAFLYDECGGWRNTFG
jgi:hypothetical protein